MVADVKLSPKCQIVIPKEFRDELGLEAGDTVRLYYDGMSLHIVEPLHWRDTFGMLEGMDLPPFERDKTDRPMPGDPGWRE